MTYLAKGGQVMKTRRKYGLTLLLILWMLPRTVFAFGGDNDIVAVRIPENALVEEDMIIASVANNVTSQTISVLVSDNARWDLYVDNGCINEITDDIMYLNVGKNTAYIKVTAEDGGTRLYTLKIIRAGISSSCSDSLTDYGYTAAVGSWQQEPTGWRYIKAGGGYLRSEWVSINEQWYYFDAAGYMLTGWFMDGDNGWYYFNPTKDENEGAMLIGWLSDPQDGNCYFLDPTSGKMALGWLQIGEGWYYFNEKGPKPLGALGLENL